MLQRTGERESYLVEVILQPFGGNNCGQIKQMHCKTFFLDLGRKCIEFFHKSTKMNIVKDAKNDQIT